MAQLRLGYEGIRTRNAEILQVTHNTPAEARMYFQRYGMTFPYLCDPDRTVHERYGIPLVFAGLVETGRNFTLCSATAAADAVRGLRPPSPAPFFRRYGVKDSGQAMFIVDRAGTIRYRHTAGGIGVLPSTGDIVRELEALQQEA